ncbi:MAG: hypothetical protein M1838_005661 [Thelocarpon superellum]|nr:MAG: hypothetical protein M1838_005661 [Thelocarpon superellum]
MTILQDYSIPDAPLTELGLAQCKQLQEDLRRDLPLADEIDLIVVSPLRRTLQTAQGGLGWLIERGVPVELHAEWQENSDKPCDTGTAVETIQPHFPTLSFATVDPAFPAKTGHYTFSQTAILHRGETCRAWLRARPEKVIAVVSHSGFLRVGVSNAAYANADYRVFDFAKEDDVEAAAEANPGNRLIEWELTREKGGGRGQSPKGWFGPESQPWPTTDTTTHLAPASAPVPVPVPVPVPAVPTVELNGVAHVPDDVPKQTAEEVTPEVPN